MDTNKKKILYKDLSYKVIGIAMPARHTFWVAGGEVHRKFGHGFLEKVYENAMMVLFKRDKIKAEQQVPIKVHFEGVIIGDYIADILVENKIILELKCVVRITDIYRAQSLNYLKATGMRLAIIINFAKEKLEYERMVL